MLLLLVLPALAWIILALDLRRRERQVASWLNPRFWAALVPSRIAGARSRKLRLWCLALALVFVALARPQWGTREEILRARGSDVMIVLDVSRSMDVEDVVPSRIKKARHWIRGFIEQIAGSRVGIVAFASSSYLACPLTTDLDYVLESVEILGPAAILNQGTDVGLGLSTALAALERGAEISDPGSSPADLSSKAIILISDGEDHEAASAEAAAKLASAGVRFFVLGVGTEKGGPIPLRDETGRLDGYKRMGSEVVLSRFDSRSLERIATDGGGRYWNMSASEGEIRDVVAALGTVSADSSHERKRIIQVERYQWPLGLAVILLVWELAVPLSTVALPLVLAFLLHSPAARAASLESYVKNREGLSLFGEGKHDQAERRFAEAQSADPKRVEPQFNIGLSQMARGNTKEAVESFEQALRRAAMEGDAVNSARSLYNLGSALEKSGQGGEALRSFARAAKMAEIAGDVGLSTESRKRIQKLQQEMQKQQSDGGEGKQGQPGSEGSGSGQDQKQGSETKEQKDQQKNFEDPSVSRRRQYDSGGGRMSREDVERVMAELSSREKELQAKLKKQRGTRKAVDGKDW